MAFHLQFDIAFQKGCTHLYFKDRVVKLLDFIWNVIFTAWPKAFDKCEKKKRRAVTWSRPMLELILKITAELIEGKVCMNLLCDRLFIHSITYPISPPTNQNY